MILFPLRAAYLAVPCGFARTSETVIRLFPAAFQQRLGNRKHRFKTYPNFKQEKQVFLLSSDTFTVSLQHGKNRYAATEVRHL